MSRPAVLALEDGTVFQGTAVGVDGTAIGEVVFNTAMTGHQEIITDPSYCRQLVTLTYPHIGNTGTNEEDLESARVHAAGLIVRDVSSAPSSWRCRESFPDFLVRAKTVAIAGIDTRRLTRIVRTGGAQAACIIAGEADGPRAVKAARRFPGLKGMDLAKIVSTRNLYQWNDGTVWPDDAPAYWKREERYHVVAYDFGIKRSILRLLSDFGCRLTVVPATTPAPEVLSLMPDGVFLSNGPGDPEPCDYAVKAIRHLLDTTLPIFGICLGHQLLALASGARTLKMSFGHHGGNHPVKDLGTGRVLITSQNHGFAVDETTLPDTVRATHRSLFDDTLQGIECTDRPAFGFQGHPEASPGPHDVRPLFARFMELMSQGKAKGRIRVVSDKLENPEALPAGDEAKRLGKHSRKRSAPKADSA